MPSFEGLMASSEGLVLGKITLLEDFVLWELVILGEFEEEDGEAISESVLLACCRERDGDDVVDEVVELLISSRDDVAEPVDVGTNMEVVVEEGTMVEIKKKW